MSLTCREEDSNFIVAFGDEESYMDQGTGIKEATKQTYIRNQQ